jgi:hypothetical protein
MPLVELPLPPDPGPPPPATARFLAAADALTDEVMDQVRAAAFVPSDYRGADRLVRGLMDAGTLRGDQFCEWGSGLGVITGLAALAGFAAVGIEIEPLLVAAARDLADRFDVPAEFVCGSFVPPGGESRVLADGNYSWFTTGSDHAYDELGLDVTDFDLVFAYPWPDEEGVTANLFERYAGVGAVLAFWGAETGFRLWRRTAKRRGR